MRFFPALLTSCAIFLLGAPNARAALVGSISTALFGYSAPNETPLGVRIGFTACPGGVGTNEQCNTQNGIDPPYIFEDIGLIESSSAPQIFTLDATTASNFDQITTALAGGEFNYSHAHRIESQSTVGIPLDGFSYGGSGTSFNLSGYWDGSNISYIQMTVDPFSFRIREPIPGNGDLLYEIYSPTDLMVRVRFDFYGTLGGYQPAAAPEPLAWSLLILGFAGAGAALRRNLMRLGSAEA